MTVPVEKMLVSTALAALAATAIAGETIGYSYDARGRLLNVVHSGSINAHLGVSYSYDEADNRTSVNVAAPNQAPPQ